MNKPFVRRNTIVFATGPKASGKTYAIQKYFTSKAPRVIHVDFVGEVIEEYPDAVECVGVRATLAQIREYALAGKMRWNIVAVFPEHAQHELATLCAALVPPYMGRAAQRVGISRAFGGVALDCTECDVLLPNNQSIVTRPARNMVKRARHEMLDLYLATQRPQECSRLATSQADIVIAFQTHEPQELDYLRKGVGFEFAERTQHLPQYHSLWFQRTTRAMIERDKDGNTVTNTQENE